jgi:hypothetical protein
MAERVPVNPGTVDWSGDNPGIYLKESPDGDFASLALFFRIVLSPVGRGHAMVVLGAPNEAKGWPAAPNLCLADNAPLARYLIDNFASKFPTFKGRAGLGAMTHLRLARVEKGGDLKARYSETVEGSGVVAAMVWKDLAPPIAIEVTPKHAVTGAHDMYSVFLEAKDAEIALNGNRLKGRPVDRPLFGRTIRSAFLAFSETWVKPPG